LYCPFAYFGSITGNVMTSWTSIFYWRKGVPHTWRGSAVTGNNSWHFIHICATKGLASYTTNPSSTYLHMHMQVATALRCYDVFLKKKNRNKLFNNTKVWVTFIIYIATYGPIARQRLGKHIPAQAYARNNRTYIARQRTSQHASLTIEAVFSVGSMELDYKEVFGSRKQ
jgi:hypothetical protein